MLLLFLLLERNLSFLRLENNWGCLLKDNSLSARPMVDLTHLTAMF